MRILHAIFSEGYSGSETVCAQLAALQTRAGHDVRLLVTDPSGSQRPRFQQYVDADQIITIPKALPSGLHALYGLKQVLGFRPQAIHTHLGRASRRLRLAARLAGVPHLATLHMGYRKNDYRTCDGLICVGAWQLQTLGGFRGKTAVVRNWIPPVRTPDKSVALAIRQSLGIGPDEHVFGSVTRFHPGKDVGSLVKAFTAAFSDSDPVHLVLVGDGEEHMELEALAGERRGRTIHFPGRQANVHDWLAAFDGFIHSSLAETMPLSVIEGLTSGAPTILSDIPAHREMAGLQEPGAIALFPPGDVSELAACLANAFRAGRTRLQYRLDPFTEENALRTTVGFYEELARG